MVDERVLNFRKQSVFAEPDSEGKKKPATHFLLLSWQYMVCLYDPIVTLSQGLL